VASCRSIPRSSSMRDPLSGSAFSDSDRCGGVFPTVTMAFDRAHALVDAETRRMAGSSAAWNAQLQDAFLTGVTRFPGPACSCHCLAHRTVLCHPRRSPTRGRGQLAAPLDDKSFLPRLMR
jgi:hypothetical protein